MCFKITHTKLQPHLSGVHELTHLPVNKMASILAEGIFTCIFLNVNVKIAIIISLKFVPKGPIDNKWALVQVMAWQ